MKRKQIFLWVQTLLVVLICVILAADAIRIYMEGLQARASDVTVWIYTREIVMDALETVLPLIAGTVGLVIIGQFTGSRDKDAADQSKSRQESRNKTADSKTADRRKTAEQKTAAVTSAVTSGMKEQQEWYSSGAVKPTRRNWMIRVILIVLAIGFIIFGIMNGSSRDVLIKAAAVCTECIGLG